MSEEQKILREIHGRYNLLISSEFQLSNFYYGYVNADNTIKPDIVDLLLVLLEQIEYPEAEKVQNYIYDKVIQNINNQDNLNLLFSKFKEKILLKKRKIYNPELKSFIKKWDTFKEINTNKNYKPEILNLKKY